MNSDSPYYVTTNSGAYLTLMKRKNSICKTLQKSKQIVHSSKQNKKTLKKTYQEWKKKIYDTSSQYITMSKRVNSRILSQSFLVKPDKQVFHNIMIPNVPVIEMQCDNDCQSEWAQIHECAQNLSMSLSLAVYDHIASRNYI